jgi:hypothetical protein
MGYGRSGIKIQNAVDQAGSELLNNRTGATSVQGGSGALDVAQTQGESTSIGLALTNVTPVTTAIIAAGVIGVWESAGVVDNAKGRFIIGEGVQCVLNVDGTTDVAKGDALKAVNAGDHFVKATVGTDRYHAIALEARTANSEGPVRALLFSSGRY